MVVNVTRKGNGFKPELSRITRILLTSDLDVSAPYLNTAQDYELDSESVMRLLSHHAEDLWKKGCKLVSGI